MHLHTFWQIFVQETITTNCEPNAVKVDHLRTSAVIAFWTFAAWYRPFLENDWGCTVHVNHKMGSHTARKFGEGFNLVVGKWYKSTKFNKVQCNSVTSTHTHVSMHGVYSMPLFCVQHMLHTYSLHLDTTNKHIRILHVHVPICTYTHMYTVHVVLPWMWCVWVYACKDMYCLLTFFHVTRCRSQIHASPLGYPPTSKSRVIWRSWWDDVQQVVAWFDLAVGCSGPWGDNLCQCYTTNKIE